ncbi:MAG TPA: 3-oxoacyl-[acyl-carrier-protein] synthase III C-terminal domain-containing protein [Candidatus Limnocylindrales bacterium]|jgi:alkylresorcinol/alkylpyrone synthase|nr:3-oxoacyl-[acyl-carrier-protein] synthase III C-terminal domain-containing protein [Candidatus Limnocylindrales bacterium]
MFIAGLGIAAPSQRYTQQQCWETVQETRQFEGLTPRSRAILKKVLTGNNGILARHLALDNLGEVFEVTPDILQARFATHAPVLAAEAAERAFFDAGITAEAIDAVIISTCTGYLCPGLTSYVGERLGLRKDVFALDLVGQGCGAALPNLRTAEALLQAGQARRVLSICVEVCSAAFYLDNDPGVLISACLFGDGAGAAVLTQKPDRKRRVEWKTSGSLLIPRDRDLLRFELRNGMLRNILAPQVPALAADQAPRVLQQVLEPTAVTQSDLTGWVLHPGGRDVLSAVAHSLGLSEADVRWSRAILEEYGNLSSPSVFFVLQAALADSVPGGYWWMAAFGAGFSGHGALLQVENP